MSHARQECTSISIAAATVMVVAAVWNPNGALAQIDHLQRQSLASNDFYPAAKIELKCTPLSIQFLSEPISLAIGGSNGQIYFSRIPDLSITSRNLAHDLAVRSLAFSQSQRVLLSTSYDKVAILRYEDEQWHASRIKAVEPVAEVFARPGDHFGLSLVGYSSRLYVSSKNELSTVDTESHLLRTGCYSACGKHICYGDRRGKILLALVENAGDWSTYRTHRVHQRTIRRVDSIPGTSNFVSVGEDGRVAVVEPDRDTAETVVENLPTKLVSCTAISSSVVAAGGTNNKIYIVDLAGRRVVQVLDDHRGTVIGLDSSGGMMASIGYDSKVILWCRQTSTPRSNLGLASSAPEVSE